jgi:hypothetical protein
MKVLITGVDGTKYYYWVETNDEEDYIQIALNKHEQLERLSAVDKLTCQMALTSIILYNCDNDVVMRT